MTADCQFFPVVPEIRIGGKRISITALHIPLVRGGDQNVRRSGLGGAPATGFVERVRISPNARNAGSLEPQRRGLNLCQAEHGRQQRAASNLEGGKPRSFLLGRSPTNCLSPRRISTFRHSGKR